MEQGNTSDVNTIPSTDHSETEHDGFVDKVSFELWRFIQAHVDRFSIYPKSRWIFALCLLGIYAYRAYINNGMTLNTI